LSHEPDNGPPVRCWLEIDLGALERNLGRIRAALPRGTGIVAELGPGAFGLGAEQVIARLMQSGVDAFSVQTQRHADIINNIGAGWPVLLEPAFAKGEADKVPAPLKGTVRVGNEFLGLPAETRKSLSGIPVSDQHPSNWPTSLSFEPRSAEPGLTPTGAYPSEPNTESPQAAADHLHEMRPATLEPAFSFHAEVGLVKDLPAGTSISYARTHTLQRDSKVAVLTVGYGDGYPTTLSNRGSVRIRGCLCPILGRVTMDQTIVDVTDCPKATIGDRATLIGKETGPGKGMISMGQVSDWAETGAEELLCALTQRVQRRYTAARVL
jgi:alanine racemase